MDSLRTVLALATMGNMEMAHFDVKTAFLYGHIDEELYLKQPEGYEDGSNRVYRLKKGLYGLKQSPRAWNKRLNDVLTNFGFRRTSADPCIYVTSKGDAFTMLALYVDDGLLCSTHKAEIDNILAALKNEFKIEVDDLTCFVGLQIERNRTAGTLKIHQTGFIKRIIECFSMENARAIGTPADVALKLTVPNGKNDINVPYREAVGSLMYAMVGTRPDIAFAVGKVAQFMDNHSNVHWTAVKNIFRYLKGTTSRGIVYKRYGHNDNLIAYTDSDWAGDLVKRRSTSGYVFLLASGAVAWLSKLQPIQAQSTCEAEYVAAGEATKQAMWMRQLLTSLDKDVTGPIVINCDNQGTIKLVDNPEISSRTKHIEMRHHFIRDRQADGVIKLEYVPTTEQAADMLTKALHGPAFNNCISLIGMD